MPSVTVLMPMYNGERHLRAAVDSILAQTFTDFELLIINDGSTDRSAEILGSYRDVRLRVVTNERNLGLSASLNRGLQAARGSLIARQDADDLSAPRRLEKQVSAMAARPEVALAGTQGFAIDEEGRRLKPVDRSLDSVSIRWYGLFDNPFIHTSVMFRRDVVERLGGFDSTFDPYSQDYALWSSIMHRCAVINLPERLVTYRVRPSSIIGAAEAAAADPRYRAGFEEIVRTLVSANIRFMFGEDGVNRGEAELMAGFVLGVDGHTADRFLAVFLRLLRLYQQREPAWRASADFRRTLARQFDAIAYRISPASRRVAWRIYAAALRHDPAIVWRLSWPRAAALTIFGKARRTRFGRLRRYASRRVAV